MSDTLTKDEMQSLARILGVKFHELGYDYGVFWNSPSGRHLGLQNKLLSDEECSDELVALLDFLESKGHRPYVVRVGKVFRATNDKLPSVWVNGPTRVSVVARLVIAMEEEPSS